jgi:DNA-3-methyladenine glycosylase II
VNNEEIRGCVHSWTNARQDTFPTAYQVATTDLLTLKAVGLSGRKAEYGAGSPPGHVTYVAAHLFAVRDLATRFADGRLTNQKLLSANDEELFELLTAVYGIGKVSQALDFFHSRH